MANEKWVLANKKADFNQISKTFHITPEIAKIIRNRDVVGEKAIHQYLEGTIEDLHDGAQMKDALKGAKLIWQAILDKKAMRIIGDYDIDGVTSTYILLQGIKRCGGQVDRTIPHRVRDGYGLNQSLIEQAKNDGIEIIITCDNGIAALEAVTLAKDYGMTVVITDHHQMPYELNEDGVKCYIYPPADAIINPHQEGCSYPFKGICGAMVAYKFIDVLYRVGQVPKEELDALIPYAAIGTVGDIMELQDENRIIVKEGLKRINQSPDVGLCALINNCKLQQVEIKAYHIGFIIGPCINASGRLESAEEALDVLLCEDEARADALAHKLVELNNIRKEMTAEYVEKAVKLIETNNWGKDRVMVVYLPECHESIAGIIAGRIRERYFRPVFVLTNGEEGVKGSGRSIEAYNMYEEMVKVAHFFTKYGGHAMAAGCSLLAEHVNPLRQALNENCTLSDQDYCEKILIDVQMSMGYVTESLIEELSKLEPYGKGNMKPIFAEKGLQLVNIRVVGQAKNVMQMKLRTVEGHEIAAICFSDPELLYQEVEDKYDKETVMRLKRNTPTKVKIMATYYPSINEYRGSRNIQIVISKYQVIV